MILVGPDVTKRTNKLYMITMVCRSCGTSVNDTDKLKRSQTSSELTCHNCGGESFSLSEWEVS